uniref:hypothetical protein n=1 Tax=Madagascaria erythrocladioides TaxID=753684 RepID=UPI001FCD46FE|nr:hypothetical protein MW574_pgp025 [Madagascaria erythrocladioides]UNJ16642.1 hypothetical protein [Madagascaria erythrocladioides]
MNNEINDFNSIDNEGIELYNLNETRPVGWSVLDETIFYYLDCNYVNMCNLENNNCDEKE